MFVYLSLCYQREQITIFLTKNILLQVFHNYFSAAESVQLFSFWSVCPYQGKKKNAFFVLPHKEILLVTTTNQNKLKTKSTNKANNSWLTDR